jgi:hypothetical protein
MRYLCITCEALARPVYYGAAKSPHVIDVELLKRGLHNQPLNLRDTLQKRIDEAEKQSYDSILLVYGLCGQATAGLVSRSVPLVIPRAHDCITLFLGSRTRYQDQFENFPGTYWYSQDYIERDDGSGSSLSMGSGADVELESVYEEYIEKYGKENADYLMEVMGAWQQHYRRAVYIDLGIGNGSGVENKSKEAASRRGWTFEHMSGDLGLIHRLLEMDWVNQPAHPDFLVVQPNQQIRMTYDENIISAGNLSSHD